MGHARRISAWLCAVIFAIGCGGGGSGTGGDGGGGGGGSGGGGGAPPTPVLDPALFDCTAAVAPARASPIPLACTVDRTCPDRLVTGHRGCGGELGVIAPENTRSAIRAAIALGVDVIETDPRETADDHLVNVHDPDVARVTKGTGDVAALTLAELQALELETSEFAGDFSCERIATIEEILLEAKGKVAVLLDANKTDRIDLLVAAVLATDTLDEAVIDTSSLDKIDAALAIEPSLHIMVRLGTEAALDEAMTKYAANPPVFVEINDAPVASLSDAVHAWGTRAFTDVFVTDIAAGFDDDPSQYDLYWDAGADNLQSDRPDLVLRNLGRCVGC